MTGSSASRAQRAAAVAAGRSCPSTSNADGLGQLLHLVIRIGVPENAADIMEEILAIDKDDGTLDSRFGGHGESKKEITRLRPFGGSAG